MKAAVFPEERNHPIAQSGSSIVHYGPTTMNRFQSIIVTCPSGSTGTQVSPQEANRNAGLLDGSWLLEAHSCDGLQGHDRKQLKNAEDQSNQNSLVTAQMKRKQLGGGTSPHHL